MQWTEGPKSERPKFITKGKVTFILEKKSNKTKDIFTQKSTVPTKRCPLI